MAQAPPIMIWQPGGGASGGPISNPPVYSQAGITQLIEGQSYIDVVFGSIQTTNEWVLATCEVENTTDFEPLNIWPGIITQRTVAGFRLQLNGMPDSWNYYLHWAVSGINIVPSVASTYLLTGPSSGGFGVASTFTVALPPSTTVPGTVTVTPHDGGAGGAFSPTSVALTTSSRSATFTYTPATYGAITISVDSNGALLDPASVAFTCVASTYTMTGPGSGNTGAASTNFTVALPVGSIVVGTVTVTLSDGGGGGTFTPTTVGLTTAAPSATFTYTPATDGTKTISATNNGGLTNPANLSYVASTPLPTYAFTGPGSGYTSLASTNFTLTLAGSPTISGTVTVTPSDGGAGGTFTPTTVGLTNAAPVQTFTYTAASTGTKTISVTNDRGLTNPGNISYVVTTLFDPTTVAGMVGWWKADALALTDGASVGTTNPWTDYSATAYHLNAGSATYKTSIVSGRAIVRFSGAQSVNRTGFPAFSWFGPPDTVLIVANQTSKATQARFFDTSGDSQLFTLDTSGHAVAYAGTALSGVTDWSGAFHVFTTIFNGPSSSIYVDSTLHAGPGASGANGLTGIRFGRDDSGIFLNGDIAEIMIYNSSLGSTDRANVESYLKGKYAIP